MNDKTHYRKAFNSPYLSSADIVGPTQLTIKFVKLEIDKSKKSKDYFNTAYFVETELRPGEKLKPMILNATNCLTVKGFADSHFIDDWNNIRVTVYVDPNVKFGRDLVEGLRIAPDQPKPKPVLTQDNTEAWARAIQSYQCYGNFDAITPHMDISDDNRKLIIEASNVS
ncbi:MAG: hypothetical protein GY781_15190 [Gammaproteobacteria bacterium]|nr:hypothetical protein [Gammaproteobacteria bacterium]